MHFVPFRAPVFLPRSRAIGGGKGTDRSPEAPRFRYGYDNTKFEERAEVFLPLSETYSYEIVIPRSSSPL